MFIFYTCIFSNTYKHQIYSWMRSKHNLFTGLTNIVVSIDLNKYIIISMVVSFDFTLVYNLKS